MLEEEATKSDEVLDEEESSELTKRSPIPRPRIGWARRVVHKPRIGRDYDLNDLIVSEEKRAIIKPRIGRRSDIDGNLFATAAKRAIHKPRIGKWAICECV